MSAVYSLGDAFLMPFCSLNDMHLKVFTVCGVGEKCLQHDIKVDTTLQLATPTTFYIEILFALFFCL